MNRERSSAELPVPQSVIQAGLHDRINHCMALMDWKAERAALAKTPDGAGRLVPDGFGFKDIAYIQELDRVFSWYYEHKSDFRTYMDQEFAKHEEAQESAIKADPRSITERSDRMNREQALERAESAFREQIRKLRAAGVSENDLYALLNKVLTEK